MSKGEGEAQKDRKKYSQRFIIETHTLVQSAILSDSIWMLMVIDLKCNMRLLRTNVTHYQAVHVLEVYKCIKMDTIDETYFAAQLHSPPPVSCVCVCDRKSKWERE